MKLKMVIMKVCKKKSFLWQKNKFFLFNKGMFFPTLYEKYLNEVNKECRIALVSFREQPQV